MRSLNIFQDRFYAVLFGKHYLKITKRAIFCLFILNHSLPLFSQSFIKKQLIESHESDYQDLFGSAVVVSGDTAVICAQHEQLNSSGGGSKSGAGACYVYVLGNDSLWTMVQKITTTDREQYDRFGGSVSLSGNQLLICSFTNDLDENQSNFLLDAGAVYLFERNAGGSYIQKQKIVHSDRQANDVLGAYKPIIHSDIALIPSENDLDTSGNFYKSSAGSVYVFEKNGAGLYQQKQKLVATDRDTFQHFGQAVGISNDEELFVGYSSSLDATGMAHKPFAGAVQVFKKNASGVWVNKQKLVASDRESNDWFGYSLSIDGDYMAVGAPLRDFSGGPGIKLNAGAVYIFKKDANDKWLEIGNITSPVNEFQANFGWEVAMSGIYLVVGSPDNSTDENYTDSIGGAGAVHIFRRDINDNYIHLQKIVNDQRHGGAKLGLELSLNGLNLLASAPFDTPSGITAGGTCTYITALDTFNSIESSDEIIDDFKISVSPNPNSGKFTLILSKASKGTLRVIDSQGKQVYISRINSKFSAIDLPESVRTGLYVLHFQSADVSVSCRIIVER